MKTNLKLQRTFFAAFALLLTVAFFTCCGKTEEEKKAEASQNYSEGLNAYEQEKYDEALTFFKKASNLGDDDATIYVGIIYYAKKLDAKEALKWYLKAAKKGNAEAQYRVGLCYNLGEEIAKGVKQDHKEAYKWFLKAAEQGNAAAQYNVGFYCETYNKETGVPFDLEEAKKWYRKAADQGDEAAMQALDLLKKREKNSKEALDFINSYL